MFEIANSRARDNAARLSAFKDLRALAKKDSEASDYVKLIESDPQHDMAGVIAVQKAMGIW